MCHVIVTCRSMLWMLLSIVVAFAELIAFMSPEWLLGFPRSDSSTSGAGVDSGAYRPSLGLYSRCLRIGTGGVSCGPYAGTFGEVASQWLLAGRHVVSGSRDVSTGRRGLYLHLQPVLPEHPEEELIQHLWTAPGYRSTHVYTYVTKPLVSWSALPPGLLLMVGLMLYPAGWGSEKVFGYCGPEALPFRPALCSLGWAFYTAIGGTLATFLCAVLSAQAEIATSSDKVQEEIEEGKSLICLL
ncbi:hypothetical protein L3Q82_023176 [Scortum barcoo]|uniref:Uncharacterized protein n=1 Tax=Scortum barcoo TaxID=214431 RepID=A0ACB8WY19_9TELE|nr:hypothetical protein L3Q82_023176 [Scortum barcoo]